MKKTLAFVSLLLASAGCYALEYLQLDESHTFSGALTYEPGSSFEIQLLSTAGDLVSVPTGAAQATLANFV